MTDTKRLCRNEKLIILYMHNGDNVLEVSKRLQTTRQNVRQYLVKLADKNIVEVVQKYGYKEYNLKELGQMLKNELWSKI